MPSGSPIRLADFILQNLEPILQRWEDFARTIEPPALTMDDAALRDHASQMLHVIAQDLRTDQSQRAQTEKSKGRGDRQAHETAAETHAAARLLSGYTIEQLVSEYRALRASVLRLWADSSSEDLRTDPRDVMRFNEAVDQLLAESVARYARMVKQSQNLLLAILGHDLRNPLGTTITASTYLMRAQDLTPKYALAANRIYSSSRRMSLLVEDLIDFTRTNLGSGLPLAPRQMNLATVCMATVDELRTLHQERPIEFSAEGELDGNWDENRIAQVFSNVIGNAIQHGTKASAVQVRLVSDGDEAVATILNQGNPIPPNKLHSVFEPLVHFVEHEEVQQPVSQSLGLGLYIAREVVNAHRGSISVTSTADAGTQFTVRLPKAPPFPPGGGAATA